MSAAGEAPAQKIVWPLFLIAALSFVPLLGVFFGAAGATWGLISSRRKAMWAAAIAMTGAVANIVGILVLSVSNDGGAAVVAVARHRETVARLHALVVALEDYRTREHSYPPSLKTLQARALPRHLVLIVDGSAGPFHLPHEYRYVLAPDGESYDLVATGPDNIFGTADDIRPVLSDSLKAHSGYRPVVPGAKP